MEILCSLKFPYACARIHACACIYVCVCRPEANVECFTLLLSTLSFETVSLIVSGYQQLSPNRQPVSS